MNQKKIPKTFKIPSQYSVKNTARAKEVKSWLAKEIFKAFSP